ncbi:D-hexose-6-phosphate mutarotase [Pseudomonas sp. P66]|jgi:glucose-6-phosphate 1-epimerase|uniref:Putative glucose-6-phosphate 1-epimerase n=1 Tax=Pseudomonas arcuscaelestis TaxID=2710591 RepID=A0ABS2BT86_9PSED|nr:D-hexose-6-phosphate mutarotase [Pseudomonas arcuscaelestis]MBM3110071.1 D-hexose-6-phosphate mutarotase [Pseudomonas arcuscaelestis]MBM5456201.1 D-hexose-6-phosphate mutarotase [Pseudomonas arcuscaelestis]
MSTPKVESEQHGELNCWRITSSHAELLIAQQGAQVLSYQRLGEPPLLWLSEQAIFKQGKSVRAGVPVCWPWFGNLKRNPTAVQAMYRAEEGPAHGLVRGRDWQLLGIDSSGESVRVEFTLPDTQGNLRDWPHNVELKLTIVMGEQLTVTLSSYNLDNAPVTLSQALHSYFAVSDVRQVQVEGVEGLNYIETLADWQQRTQQGALVFASETDRIYLQSPEQLHIVDPAWNRRIRLTSSGSRSAVIWNPWTARAVELADMANDGWQRMLCIETANVWDDIVTLAPGATHSLSLCISSEPL